MHALNRFLVQNGHPPIEEDPDSPQPRAPTAVRPEGDSLADTPVDQTPAAKAQGSMRKAFSDPDEEPWYKGLFG